MNNPLSQALNFLRDFGPLPLPAHGGREPWQAPYDTLVSKKVVVVTDANGASAYAYKVADTTAAAPGKRRRKRARAKT
jgi:hypothetical protein